MAFEIVPMFPLDSVFLDLPQFTLESVAIATQAYPGTVLAGAVPASGDWPVTCTCITIHNFE